MKNVLCKCYITCLFGCQVELNEIESSCEEYPLTRAFCHLTSTLVESSLPVNLGAGLRVPGFQPYLNFLRDAVFLPFPTRAYRRPAEKVKCCVVYSTCLYKVKKRCCSMRACSLNYTYICSFVFHMFPSPFSVGGC